MSKDSRIPFIQEHLSNLVKSVAGDNATLAEIQTFEQFAFHKLHTYRGLSTNSHEVRRSLNNTIERFRCEGMSLQADTLRHLSKVLLDDEGWKSHYETDVQYSIMDFLISTAYAPIQTVRRNRRLHDMKIAILHLDTINMDDPFDMPKTSSPETDVDWVALLSEDFIKVSEHDSDSNSVLSAWSNVSEPESSTEEEETDVESATSQQNNGATKPRALVPLALHGYLNFQSRYADSESSAQQDDLVVLFDGTKNWPRKSPTTVSFASHYAEEMTNAELASLQNDNAVVLYDRLRDLTICPSDESDSMSLSSLSSGFMLPISQVPSSQLRYTESCTDILHLPKKVHSMWWCEQMNIYTMTLDNDPMANFAIAFAQHLNEYAKRVNADPLVKCIEHPVPNTVTENCLLREILLMFVEPTSCFFFYVHPETREIIVRSNVSICTVSSDTIKTVLETEVLPAIQAMQQLRKTIKKYTLLKSDSNTTGTLECFAVSLRDLITPIRERLFQCEEYLLKDDDDQTVPHLTLINFLQSMSEHFQQLLLLQKLASQAIVDAPPHLRSAYLISQLIRHTKITSPHQRMAMALLLMTLQRYCGIIDNWWRSADMNDCHNEFLVESRRNDRVRRRVQQIQERILPVDADETHHIMLEKLRSCTFYQLFVDHAIESAETQNLLASLNLLGDLLVTNKQQRSLHLELTQQLFEELQSFGSVACPVGRRRTDFFDGIRQEISEELEQFFQIAPTMAKSELVDIFTAPLKLEQQQRDEMLAEVPPIQVLDILEALEKFSPLQLPQVLPRALAKVLRKRTELSNAYVMRWYREVLHLGDHVRFLRHLLMLEADYLVYPFYTHLFCQIESGEPWSRNSELTRELYIVLDAHYPRLAGNIYVDIYTSAASQSTKVFEALNEIEVKYSMPAALSIIVTEKQMKRYNKIWRLLLKIKWAAWKLENMRFFRRTAKDLYAPLDLLGYTVRRLEMLRFWIIYLINSIHTHLCTHVIQAMGLQFEQQLKETRNMRELAQLHDEYLLRLSEHCLLNDEFSDFQSALEQIFHLIFVLDMEWHSCTSYLNESHAMSLDITDSDADSVSVSHNSLNSTSGHDNGLEYLALNQVTAIESTYIRCHQMLATSLTTLVYKHDYKIFSSLELALCSSVPC